MQSKIYLPIIFLLLFSTSYQLKSLEVDVWIGNKAKICNFLRPDEIRTELAGFGMYDINETDYVATIFYPKDNKHSQEFRRSLPRHLPCKSLIPENLKVNDKIEVNINGNTVILNVKDIFAILFYKMINPVVNPKINEIPVSQKQEKNK